MTGLFSPAPRCRPKRLNQAFDQAADNEAKTTQAIEHELVRALAFDKGLPLELKRAMEAAVLAGGGRIRPRLCLAVFDTLALSASSDRSLAIEAAAAVELMHCASLVHDDLPCFDDAATRRGRPSVHRQFGEPLAVLTGNALMMLAMRWLAQGSGPRSFELVALLGDAAAKTISGQAMESEPTQETQRYHRHKTGALFEFSVIASTRIAGCSPALEAQYLRLATTVGDIYQLADDLLDTAEHAPKTSEKNEGRQDKPVGQDLAHKRPNLALDLGKNAAQDKLRKAMEMLLHLHPGEASLPPWRRFVSALSHQIEPLLFDRVEPGALRRVIAHGHQLRSAHPLRTKVTHSS